MSDKVKVVYHAPEGDSKVCEMGGHTFFDGRDTELDSDHDAALIDIIKGNHHFTVGGERANPKPPPAPPKAPPPRGGRSPHDQGDDD